MENEFFLNAGVGPLIHLESSDQIMPNWKQFPHSMGQNCSSDRSPDCFYTNPSWEKSTDHQSMQFDSALSSMVSSPVASNSNISNDSFIIRELIGKLGNIGNNTSEISIPAEAAAAAAAAAYQHRHHHYSNSTNTSCYSTPLNSPPKIPLSLNSTVAEFAADPGFAERAARFSCFGSRSFNGRTSQFALNNGDYNNNNTNNNSNNNNNNNIPGGSNSNSNPLAGNCKLSRVSSSPSLKALGVVSQMSNSPLKDRTSQEESTVSEQNPNGEKALKQSNEMNSRKRKAASKGKAKETVLPSPPPSSKTVEPNDHSNSKRNRTTVEGEGNEMTQTKAEEETKTSPKPPEPPKDYIHVRARRGQATDSHSLAERVRREKISERMKLLQDLVPGCNKVRREKISERMKLLQDLVPGCNKVTGKALMLDEIINYVQSLQRQVEFLSMKLASVNNRLDANIDTLMSKDIFQPNSSMAHPIFPLDSSAQAVYGHHQHHISCSNGPVAHCSTDPLDTPLLPPHLNGFSDIISQCPAFGEDDLQAIVQMGFGQIPNGETSLQPQSLHGPNQVSHMKVEL